MAAKTHTPTQLVILGKVKKIEIGGFVVVGIEGFSTSHGEAYVSGTPLAERICLACNSFEQMRDALEAAVEVLRQQDNECLVCPEQCGCDECVVIVKIDAALAAAKGEKP